MFAVVTAESLDVAIVVMTVFSAAIGNHSIAPGTFPLQVFQYGGPYPRRCSNVILLYYVLSGFNSQSKGTGCFALDCYFKVIVAGIERGALCCIP